VSAYTLEGLQQLGGGEVSVRVSQKPHSMMHQGGNYRRRLLLMHFISLQGLSWGDCTPCHQATQSVVSVQH
jgi:hypothetical protein